MQNDQNAENDVRRAEAECGREHSAEQRRAKLARGCCRLQRRDGPALIFRRCDDHRRDPDTPQGRPDSIPCKMRIATIWSGDCATARSKLRDAESETGANDLPFRPGSIRDPAPQRGKDDRGEEGPGQNQSSIDQPCRLIANMKNWIFCEKKRHKREARGSSPAWSGTEPPRAREQCARQPSTQLTFRSIHSGADGPGGRPPRGRRRSPDRGTR